jgi:hypothetical protein
LFDVGRGGTASSFLGINLPLDLQSFPHIFGMAPLAEQQDFPSQLLLPEAGVSMLVVDDDGDGLVIVVVVGLLNCHENCW